MRLVEKTLDELMQIVAEKIRIWGTLMLNMNKKNK